ncbi:MAG: cyclic nucleotide-binding domain-containing protein [Gammaproteobacteria bacterium]
MDNDLSEVDQEQLKRFEPLATLAEHRIEQLITLTTLSEIQPGEVIFDQNLTEKQAIFLLVGDADVTVKGKEQPLRVSAGDNKARFSLTNPGYLAAIAVSACKVIRIDGDLLDMMMAWDQLATAETQAAEDDSQIDNSKFLNGFHKSFQQIPIAHIGELFERVEPIPVESGELIIEEGDEGDYFYLIEYGVARVTRKDETSGDDIHLADLGEGTSFGEDALLTDNKRNATVRMNTRGVLLRLYKDDFLELLNQPALDWVDGKAAANLIKQGAQWLDVRHDMEYQQSRLPGATNLPLHELRQREEELNRNQHYICYCNSGRRSSAAAFALAKAGLKVSVLEGGLQQLMAPPVKKAS